MSATIGPALWRMQLHPSEPSRSSFYAAASLSAGFIGLDFDRDYGDMLRTHRAEIPSEQRNYLLFATDMKVGDHVLVFTHHNPFAMATVSGDYNYIREPVPEIGVWFRHFRRVRDIHYYSDFHKSAKDWPTIVMTTTITPLRDIESQSYVLLSEWLRAKSPATSA